MVRREVWTMRDKHCVTTGVHDLHGLHNRNALLNELQLWEQLSYHDEPEEPAHPA